MYKVVEKKNGKTQNGCNLRRCQRICRLGHLGVDGVFHLGIRENVLAIQGMAGLTPHRRLANSWDYAET
jgi:hypothetical protein